MLPFFLNLAINKSGKSFEQQGLLNLKSVLESWAGRKPTPPRQLLQRGEPAQRTGSTFRKI